MNLAPSDTPCLHGNPSPAVGRLWSVFQVVLLAASLCFLAACRSPQPAVPAEPTALVPVEPAESEPVIVHPTKAVTNSLRHVTYTFQLPRLPERGYIIEESLDGEEWTILGRSSATHLRQVTVVDATPDSGKLWRVTLP
jgi:hypothetical protein